jgi:hypothetical protein
LTLGRAFLTFILDMTSRETVQAIVPILAPYIGDTMARSATEAHCQKLGIAGDRVSPEQVEALLAKLSGGLNIFLGRETSAAVMADVRKALASRESG